MRRPRRNHGAEFKAKVALAAMRGDLTLTELAKKFDVHANQITQWKTRMQSRAAEAFGGGQPRDPQFAVKELQARIGALTMANGFLEHVLGRIHGASAKR